MVWWKTHLLRGLINGENRCYWNCLINTRKTPCKWERSVSISDLDIIQPAVKIIIFSQYQMSAQIPELLLTSCFLWGYCSLVVFVLEIYDYSLWLLCQSIMTLLDINLKTSTTPVPIKLPLFHEYGTPSPWTVCIIH